MDCNKEEATRAKEIADGKMQSGDFVGARKIALKAQQLHPQLENIPQMITVCNVLCSSAFKVTGSEPDWYAILDVECTTDEESIKNQYEKLALLLHPDNNKFAGADVAFKLIGEAHRVLSDQARRSLYDVKRSMSFGATGIRQAPPHLNRNSNAWKQANIQKTTISTSWPSSQSMGMNHQKTEVTDFWAMCSFCFLRIQCCRRLMNKAFRCPNCQHFFIAYDISSFGQRMQQGAHAGFGSNLSSMTQQTEVLCRNDTDVIHQASVNFNSNTGSHGATVRESVSFKVGGRTRSNAAEVKAKSVKKTGESQEREKNVVHQKAQNRKRGRNMTEESSGIVPPVIAHSSSHKPACRMEESGKGDFDTIIVPKRLPIEQHTSEAPKLQAKTDSSPKPVHQWILPEPTNPRQRGALRILGAALRALSDEPPEGQLENEDLVWMSLEIACKAGIDTSGLVSPVDTFFGALREYANHAVHLLALRDECQTIAGSEKRAHRSVECTVSIESMERRRTDIQTEIERLTKESESLAEKICEMKAEIANFNEASRWLSFLREPLDRVALAVEIPQAQANSSCSKHSIEHEGCKKSKDQLDHNDNNVQKSDIADKRVDSSSNKNEVCDKNLKHQGSTTGNPGGFVDNKNEEASMINDTDALGVYSGNIFDCPDSEFFAFDATRTENKFLPGQIWAVYCDIDGLPKFYVQIKEVNSGDFKVKILRLKVRSPKENEMRWSDEKLPVGCGMFRVMRHGETYDTTLVFSHQVKAELVSWSNYCIYPRSGEVWAVYKNLRVHWTEHDLKKCEYEIVRIVQDTGFEWKVMVLNKVGGYNSIFGDAGLEYEILREDSLQFSHEIPAFQLIEEEGGKLRGQFELDTAAVPPVLFC